MWHSCQGSPPRGRGKGGYAQYPDLPPGITPAWAGKSKPDSQRGRETGDHPRMGGEKFQSRFQRRDFPGSPPHGRGKVRDERTNTMKVRITPAWAGKSRAEASCGCARRDHPRVGGEKNIVRKASFDPQGSPPRGRGKAACGALAGGVQRITPAWAGKRPVPPGSQALR